MVRVVAREARGPGFDSSSDPMVFLLSLGSRRKERHGCRHSKLCDPC